MLKNSICLLFILVWINTFSQNTLGLPTVINYSKFDYNGGLQSWDIKQSKQGVIYFANNEGLLSFDGVYWKINPLPNKTIVRAIYIDNTKIYVGGQDELGYFSPTKSGNLEYIDLLPLIPEKDRKFGDVWDIIASNDAIFVRTNKKIFKITNTRLQTFYALSEWYYVGVYKNKVIAQDAQNGLYFLDDNSNLANSTPITLPFQDNITAILENDNTAIITTIKNGIFYFNNNIVTPNSNLQNLKKERIYKATLIDKETIALATNYNGIYIIDFNGNEKQHFSKTEGLQNNNVLSVFADKQKNLWLGLDNGIDFIAYNSAIKQIDPNAQNSSAYTAIIKDNTFYIGTSNGLYATPIQNMEDISFSKGSFTIVPNSNGQVWSLAEINNRLLMGHHEGAFSIANKQASQVSNSTGFWNFLPYNNFTQNNVISGTYKGLSFLYNNGSTIIAKDSIHHFDESSRFITTDAEGAIWVSHPYHGVFKVAIHNQQYNVQTYTENDGLPSTLNNHVYKIKNEVVVATIKGIYIYNKTTNRFTPSDFYKPIFGATNLRYLKEDTKGNIWFISEKQLGVATIAEQQKSVQFFPELNNRMLSGFEFIYPFNNNNIFIGGAKGLYNINYEKYKTNSTALPILIRNVSIVNKIDSVLYAGNFLDSTTALEVPEVASQWKLIRFQFASPSYGNQANVEYSYRLNGFDKNWSEWTKRTEKEYTNLPAGKYTFEVKVKNNLGTESPIASYTFRLLPPWYLSKVAFCCYLFLAGVLIYAIIRWQKKKFVAQKKQYDAEQQKLLYILELERSKKESEIIALQNEKLASEINFQTTELATSAMHLVKKGELITKIKEDLAQVTKAIDNTKITSEIKKITKALNEDENMDKEWEHFSKHFDKVHSDFLVTLKNMHPTITPNELKLSAYLRMNLSTKEIAQLMNISVRGVEISRYRLRKKLAILSETSLFDYLVKVQSKR